MIGFRGNNAHLCDHLTRRELLRIGAITPLGLSLPRVLRAEAQRGRGPG